MTMMKYVGGLAFEFCADLKCAVDQNFRLLRGEDGKWRIAYRMVLGDGEFGRVDWQYWTGTYWASDPSHSAAIADDALHFDVAAAWAAWSIRPRPAP